MSMTLMHIEHHPTDFTVPTDTFRRIADVADSVIEEDDTLETGDQNDPARINILHNVLIDTEGSFTTNRDAVERFADVIESERFRKTAGAELAELAAGLGAGLRNLAAEHEILHLTLT